MNLRAQRTRTAWLLLAPMLLALSIVVVWPLARSFWFGLTDASLDEPELARFVGLENFFGPYGLFLNPNYVDGFWASEWGISIRNTLWFALISVGLETVLGLALALLLNQEFAGRRWVRTAVLVPWAIPTVVSAQMWSWMLHDQFGVVNHYLLNLGLLSERLAWTADPDLALWSVVAVDVWKTTPFMALLILAALQTLPKDIYEAARLEGASAWTTFRQITLPLIWGPLIVAVVFRMLDALRVFDLIYIMTSNSTATMSMSGFVRREMVENGNLGFSAAASTVLFLMLFAAAYLLIRLTRFKLAEAR
ncbi:MAG: sugar ABC transporter permease [Betaproteobacteria bacterium]|jgi:trehalose/maltose transport system permease protein|nr:sugar ABC transporter permease [Betaproteobacteria bacterium]